VRKCRIIIVVIMVAGILLGTIPMAVQAEVPQAKGKFALGMDAVFPVTGLSGKYWFSDKLGGQAIIGLFGDLSMYGGRVLYKFREGENHYLYGALLVGNWTYEWDWGWLGSGSESAFGFGINGGIEYFTKFIPQLGFTLEIGYGSVKLEHYDYKALSYGTGIHYYF